MIVDKGQLGNDGGGKAAAAAATSTVSAADGSSSSSSSGSTGSVEEGRTSIRIGGGCGAMAGTSGEEGGGGGPSCSSVAIVRGDLTSIDIAAEIKSFAATGYAASSGGDSDDATTSQLSIFHLASVMSGHAENDFDEALRVNVEGK